MLSSFDPPNVWLAVLWGLWLLQAIWCWFNAGQYLQRVRRADRREQSAAERGIAYAPPAALIVAVKGGGERFERHLDAICHQRYPRYRIVFAVESEDDPACAVIRRARDRYRAEPSETEGVVAERTAHFSSREREGQGAARLAALDNSIGPTRIDLLVAGHARRGGQKVHNLIHAVRSLEEEDEAVVFTDADTTPDPDWMRRLVYPLHHEEVGASTGYRWLIPAGSGEGERANLPTRLACVINASVATLQGPPRRSHAWGGSTAIRRETLERVRLLDYWDGALSDDYQLTRAVKQASLEVRFDPRLLLPSEASFTWRSLFEFGRRQYLITRVYSPGIWLIGLLATAVYTAGWVSVGAAMFSLGGGWVWGLVVSFLIAGFDFCRGWERLLLMDRIFDEATAAKLKQADPSDLELAGGPFYMFVHLLLILASALGRRITWAGITYHLRSRRDAVIEDREKKTFLYPYKPRS